MSIIIALLIFSLLVVVHEWGHYIAAKKCGVYVKEFAIGMGPAIFKHQGKETLFSIRCLPIGGYCSMEGEEEASTNENAFCNKKTWQKILIVVAGATMNIVSAYLILIIISNFIYVSTNKVASVDEGSYAEQAGILPGDELVGVNGKTMNMMEKIRLAILLDNSENKTLDVMVKRDDQILEMPVKYLSYVEIADLGKHTSEFLTVGTKIEEINGVNVADLKSISDAVKEEEVSIKLLNDDTTYSLTEEERKIVGNNAVNLDKNIGVKIGTRRLNFGESIVYGIKKGNYYVYTVYKSLALIFTRSVSKDQVSGPVGIIKIISDTYVKGKESGVLTTIINLASFMAMIGINLGVINLLPFPALDGGRFVILLVELVRRKPMDIEKEAWVHLVGFALLMVLMVVILYNDIVKIIGF